jgi:hypothetical protein
MAQPRTLSADQMGLKKSLMAGRGVGTLTFKAELHPTGEDDFLARLHVQPAQNES